MLTVCRVCKHVLMLIGGVFVAANLAHGQAPASAQAERASIPTTCVDIVLAPGGVLSGQVRDDQTAPCGDRELVLMQVGQETARTITDAQGMFQISGIRGGAYVVSAGAMNVDVRLWTEGTAPPSASNALLLTVPNDVVRGQGAGSTFWRTVTNPWVSAGLIGAAIAVPIALNNNDSGS